MKRNPPLQGLKSRPSYPALCLACCWREGWPRSIKQREHHTAAPSAELHHSSVMRQPAQEYRRRHGIYVVQRNEGTRVGPCPKTRQATSDKTSSFPIVPRTFMRNGCSVTSGHPLFPGLGYRHPPWMVLQITGLPLPTTCPHAHTR